MQLKATCLFLIVLLCTSVANAQDVIYKKTGGTIDAHVKKITDDIVTYKRYHDGGGALYSIPRPDVAKIIYSNGVIDSFVRNNGAVTIHHKNRAKDTTFYFGRNLISLIPIAYSFSPAEHAGDPGVGIAYEVALDRKGHLSLALPLLINFTTRDYKNYVFYNPSRQNSRSYNAIVAMPGVKFYPVAANKIDRYAIGLSFFNASGSEPHLYYSLGGYNISGDHHYVINGIMITNSFNFSLSEHMYFAIDANVCQYIADSREDKNVNFNNGISGLSHIIQVAGRIGYRF